MSMRGPQRLHPGTGSRNGAQTWVPPSQGGSCLPGRAGPTLPLPARSAEWHLKALPHSAHSGDTRPVWHDARGFLSKCRTRAPYVPAVTPPSGPLSIRPVFLDRLLCAQDRFHPGAADSTYFLCLHPCPTTSPRNAPVNGLRPGDCDGTTAFPWGRRHQPTADSSSSF